MPEAKVNGVRLHYELDGTGEPLILIHGSWTDHSGWSAVVPGLADSLRVLRYDRRGHSASERPAGQGSVLDDVADAVALLEHLGLGPAHVVGNSYGAAIALRVAAAHPDMVRTVTANEPPLLSLLEGSGAEDMIEAARAGMEPVVELIADGRHAEAAERFIDDVALGPGGWASLPDELQRIIIGNAPTFLDEMRDPDSLEVVPADTLELDRIRCPVLLTGGTESPPFFALILERLARTLPRAVRHTYAGAGHVPHITHPEDFVKRVVTFTRKGA